MLDFKKKVDPIVNDELRVTNCPVCNSYVCHAYYMVDKSANKKSRWFSCSCGAIFNSQKPTKVYDSKYWLEHSKHDEKQKDSYQYLVNIYSPIIEELIYGRRVLIVGRPNTYQEEAFIKRGWVPTVIDKNTCFETKGNVIASDFETYQFPERWNYDKDGNKTTKIPNFNLIWIADTLECLSNPIGSLELCKNLLAEDGVIFISTPDTDFINTRSNSCFIHWKSDEHYIMWNKRAITKYMESIGFNIIMCRSNYEHRFNSWDNIHGIWQRRFF